MSERGRGNGGKEGLFMTFNFTLFQTNACNCLVSRETDKMKFFYDLLLILL